MKIRNPFKKWGQWRDDITKREKNAWTLISVLLGMTIGWIINSML